MTKGAKPDTWMPLFIGDYLADTARLNTEQHGAYMLLIMDYWRNGPPADDDEELSEITRLDLRTWRRHRPKIERFFRVIEGLWRHKRIDEELVTAQGRSDRAAEKASIAAHTRWERERAKQSQEDAASTAPSNASSMLEGCPSPSPSPKVGPNGPAGPRVGKAEVDQVWDITPARGRERSSRRDIERALKAAVSRGFEVPAVVAGLRAYYATRDATRNDGEFARGAHRMIENDRWLEFSPAAGSPDDAPPPARQRSWMEDWKTSPNSWKVQDRGPRPGEPGCRVAVDIQREYGVEAPGELLPFPSEGRAVA